MVHHQRHSFINSQADSHTFPDEMNWQFVQILMIPNSSQNFVYWTPWWGKTKDFFVFCSGKMCLYVFTVFDSFVLSFFVLFFCCHPVHLFNTWIFNMNVKCRMDGSHRKPYICFSFDFSIQYSANGTRVWKGGGGGIMIPHSRPFFARIPHPARFSSLSRIPLFFPRKIH